MIITRKALPRRTILRGVGASLALPFLDSMVPALTATAKSAAAPIPRFSVVYIPHGAVMANWTPGAEGAAFELTPVLRPLEAFRSQMLILSGLNGNKIGGAHAGAATRFLTGAASMAREDGPQIHADVSIDQIAAREFGKTTQLASLEVALEGRDFTGSCDAGYSCAYTNTIAWRNETTPLPMENDPRVLFERLFGDSGSTSQAARSARMKTQRSIVDSIMESIRDLERGLGPNDRGKLTQYIDGVRDIERRIENTERQNALQLPVVDQPSGVPGTFENHAKLMFDLQVLAFQSDMTRVITFMLGREVSGRTYPEIGVTEAHHPLSHHENNPEKMAFLTKLQTYHATMLAYYLEKLRSTRDGEGSLLDSLTLLYGSGMSDSNAHSPENLPLLLLGGGAGKLKGGRHLKYPDDTPMANLLPTLLDIIGVPVERVGSSKGPLPIDPLSV